MIKSMTGFSKAEAKEKGTTLTIEIKSLNGRFLDIKCKIPWALSHKEIEIRELARTVLGRGSVTININIESDNGSNNFNLNEKAAQDTYKKLVQLRKKLKIEGEINIDHLLHFSNSFQSDENGKYAELYWKLTLRAMKNSLREIDKMKKIEGIRILRDLQSRLKLISTTVDKIEILGIERIPEERERLRIRVAQLFESDEIDEQRLQMEMVMQADKLDISEECLRLKSHFKFFFDTLKQKESAGKKLNFLLQEMHREINTIGSKINDANISQMVVNVKEELEKIREQVQNIE